MHFSSPTQRSALRNALTSCLASSMLFTTPGEALPERPSTSHGLGSTIVTSQLPVNRRHQVIGNPTIADGAVTP
jgi:hypothetical protein